MAVDSDRVIEIRARKPDGDDAVGSGFRVTERLLLTARHLVWDKAGVAHSHVRVRLPEHELEATSPGRVVWHGAGDVDVALVEVAAAAPSAQGAIRTAWGRLTGQQAGVSCEAEGYPRFTRKDDTSRSLEHLDGHINPGTARGRRYDVNLESAVPEPGLWGGLSGAALFAGRLLIGVVVIDTPHFDGRRLTAVPVHRVTADPGFRACLERAGAEPQIESVELAALLAGSVVPSRPRSVTMLLRADAEAVSFHGRRALLDDLHNWCDAPEPLSCQLITGPGGQGKTRVARQLCQERRARDWIAGFAASEPGEQAIAPLSHTAMPVLLIFDYAEMRAEQVKRVIESLSQRLSSAPIRLLLLARSAGEWWAQLIDASIHTEAALADAPVTELRPLDETLEARRDVRTEALADLAARLEDLSPGADWPAVAAGLREHAPAMAAPASALTIQLTALTELLQAGPQPVTGASGEPGDTLRRHEQRYWALTATQHGIEFGGTDLRDFAVVAATLMGARTRAEARATVGRLPELRETASAVAAWLHELYPPEAGAYWGSLQPDRLGEDLVARMAACTPGYFTSALRGATDDQRHLALTVLARAADRHPDLGPFLSELLQNDLDGLAVHVITVATQAADSKPLTTALLEATRGAEVTTLAPLVDEIPTQTTALASLAAELAERLVQGMRQAEAVPEHLAVSLNNLAIRQQQLSRLPKALAAGEEAVALFRRLVDFGRDEYRPKLATALGTTASVLNDLWRHPDALEAGREAVAITRSLVEVDPERHRGDLARLLTTTANDLRRLHRPREALDASEEAVAHFRSLAAAEPDEHRDELAHALVKLARDLEGMERPEPALAAAREAVDLYRDLAAGDPDAHLPNLARALTRFAAALTRLDCPEHALAADREAVALYRPLAAANGAQHGVDAANALFALAEDFGRLRRPEEALAAGHEALGLYRSLAAENPAAHSANFVQALIMVAIAALEHGDPAAALAASEEAVEGFDRVAASDRRLPEDRLGMALELQGASLMALGHLAEGQALRDKAKGLLK